MLAEQSDQYACEEEEEEVVQQEEEVVIEEVTGQEEEEVEEEVVVEGDDGGMVLQEVEEEEEEEECPAVIVEEVPSAQVEQCYAAQVLVYGDETYLMQDVADEQEVVTEVVETGESELCSGGVIKVSFWPKLNQGSFWALKHIKQALSPLFSVDYRV